MTEDILDRLAKSKFRSSFRLSKKYRDYAAEKERKPFAAMPKTLSRHGWHPRLLQTTGTKRR